jgi:hypothetical protein
MNYPEPGSPAPSTPSSGSPPPDELPDETQIKTSSWASALAGALNPRVLAPGKRRQPPGGGPAGSSTRDAKTRRRDEGAVRKQGSSGPGTAGWTEGKQKEKDELLDVALAERMRKGTIVRVTIFVASCKHDLHSTVDFGDPFDETFIKSAAK